MAGKDASTIDLVLPGLLNLPAHELNLDELASSTPILHKLLRFAERVNSSITDFDDILIKRLGLQQPATFSRASRGARDQSSGGGS